MQNPGTSNLVNTSSARWSELTPCETDEIKEDTKMLKETKKFTFIDPSHSLDSIPKHGDDEVVTVTDSTSKEASTILLTQSANSTLTAPKRITTRSIAKANPNVQQEIHKQ